MAIQVTLNIDGDALAPTLKDVLASMTDADKSKLVADIAYQYFATEMARESGRLYSYNRYKAVDFLGELSRHVKNEVGKRLIDDPSLNDRINTVLEAVRPQLGDFVRQAVVSILASKLAEAFQSLSDLQQQHIQVEERLKKIGQTT